MGKRRVASSVVLGLAGAFIGTAIPAEVSAQVNAADAGASSAPSAPSAKTAESEKNATQLDTVVVTAQKRKEKLQEVPIAITAINSQQLESRGIENVADLSALAPGLQVSESPSNGSISQIAIRGSTEINPAIYWDPAVGIYLDGVYLGKSQGSVFDVVNLERVEVLRGPQGTLYGRNTIGGAINLVTRAPTGVFAGDASLEIGNYNAMVQKLDVDLPKWGIASISLGARSERRDGWVNGAPGSSASELDNRDNTGLRGAVNFDFGPVQADYRFDRSVIDSAGSFGQLYRLTPTGAFDPAAPGGALYAGLAPYVSQDRQTEADVNAPSSEKVRVEGHSLTLTWTLNELQQLKSITAYRHLTSDDAADYDGTPQAIAATQRLTNFHQISQELQWLGRWQRLNWVGGLYYYGDDGFTNNPQTYFFGGQNFDSEYGTRTKAYAAYGQVDYKLLDPLTLTAGLRYTHEQKELDRIFGVSYAGGPYNYLIPAGTHADGSFNATTPSFAINYQVIRQLNLYARYAEGFKSGGFNGEYSDTTQSSQQNINETQTAFRPEKQRSFELGAKGSAVDNRVQFGVAAFQNKLTDLQESIFQATGAAASVIRNAGSATVHGVEVEGAVVPITGTRLSANYAWLDPRFDDFEDAGQNVASNRAYVHTPRNAFNLVLDSRLAKYRWGTVKALADYAWTGSYYLYPYQVSTTDPTRPTAGNTRVESYGLLNLRLALTGIPLGETFSGDLALWMRNATDEKVAANFIDFGPGFGNLTDAYFIDPRTFGITGTIHW